MAFKFNWPVFDAALLDQARKQLTTALNAGERHPAIADDIIVHELNPGSKPPELAILEISDVSQNHFRGIFEVSYDGDAYIVLHTKAQANPIHPTKPRSAITRHGILAANKRLVVPLEVRISAFRINGVAVLDVSKTDGVTLSFKNDPLKGVLVNTTFDDQPNVKRQLQNMIEEQLRILVNHDLPRIIHLLSLGKENAEKAKQRDASEFRPEPTPYSTPQTSPTRSKNTSSFSFQSVLQTMAGTNDADNEIAELLAPSRNANTAHMASLSTGAATIYPYSGAYSDTGVTQRVSSMSMSSSASTSYSSSPYQYESDPVLSSSDSHPSAAAASAHPAHQPRPPSSTASNPGQLFPEHRKESVVNSFADVIASAVNGFPLSNSSSSSSPSPSTSSSSSAAFPSSPLSFGTTTGTSPDASKFLNGDPFQTATAPPRGKPRPVNQSGVALQQQQQQQQQRERDPPPQSSIRAKSDSDIWNEHHHLNGGFLQREAQVDTSATVVHPIRPTPRLATPTDPQHQQHVAQRSAFLSVKPSPSPSQPGTLSSSPSSGYMQFVVDSNSGLDDASASRSHARPPSSALGVFEHTASSGNRGVLPHHDPLNDSISSEVANFGHGASASRLSSIPSSPAGSRRPSVQPAAAMLKPNGSRPGSRPASSLRASNPYAHVEKISIDDALLIAQPVLARLSRSNAASRSTTPSLLSHK